MRRDGLLERVEGGKNGEIEWKGLALPHYVEALEGGETTGGNEKRRILFLKFLGGLQLDIGLNKPGEDAGAVEVVAEEAGDVFSNRRADFEVDETANHVGEDLVEVERMGVARGRRRVVESERFCAEPRDRSQL